MSNQVKMNFINFPYIKISQRIQGAYQHPAASSVFGRYEASHATDPRVCKLMSSCRDDLLPNRKREAGDFKKV